MYMRIKTGTLFTQYVVTKGDPSSWRMKEKRRCIKDASVSRITENRCYCGDGGSADTAIGDSDRTLIKC